MPNPLTLQEILAAHSCINFSTFFFADGRGNLTPEAAIAQVRGARFTAFGPMTSRDMLIIDNAMKDLAAYLGFASTTEYSKALFYEGNNIFKRVNNGNV